MSNRPPRAPHVPAQWGRRSFLKSAAGAAVAGYWPQTSHGVAAENRTPRDTRLPNNWLWMRPGTHRTDDDWKRLFERIKRGGVDAVVPEVYNGSTALFEHPNPHVPTRAAVLEQMIRLGRDAGIQVHAWMWTVPCTNRRIVQDHGDWYAVNGLGDPANTKPAYVGYYKFLCPRRPAARAFIEANVAALAAIPGLDGVHLDYVRLPDVILAKGLWAKYGIVQDREYPQYDYCYCDHCRQEFQQQTGIDPLKDLKDPAANDAWRQFRYDGVSELVKTHLAPQARKEGKVISAAVFPNWQYVRQEWHTWGLDAYLPMLYHSFYDEDIDWIGAETRKAIERFETPAPVYPGLFVSSLRPNELADAIRSGRDGGGSGFALFDAGAIRSNHWDVLAEHLNSDQ